MEVLFNTPLVSVGRNGTLKTTGVALVESSTNVNGTSLKTVQIYPITSKGNLGNCMITVPEDVLISLSAMYIKRKRDKKS